MTPGDEHARYLRNNSTPPEVYLWNQLKQDQIGFQFRRQKRFGPYILDFYCSLLKLAIEIDGKVHALKMGSDENRDQYLRSEGVTILRFSARAIYKDSWAVAQRIREVCEQLQSCTYTPDNSD